MVTEFGREGEGAGFSRSYRFAGDRGSESDGDDRLVGGGNGVTRFGGREHRETR